MPLYYIIALFVGLPIVELALLFKVDERVGLGATVLLVLLTGITGATLVRRQGMGILFKIQHEMSEGRLPAPQMIDGIMLLVAGALMITPGLITDTVGFALLIPRVRTWLRGWLRKKLEQKLRSGDIHIHVGRPGGFE